jgi:hypothetical protein
VQEGVIAFYQDVLAMFFYSGTRRGVPYTEIVSFWLSAASAFANSPLHGTDGQTRHLRIGPELAANAKYVLSAKGIAQRSPGLVASLAASPAATSDRENQDEP